MRRTLFGIVLTASLLVAGCGEAQTDAPAPEIIKDVQEPPVLHAPDIAEKELETSAVTPTKAVLLEGGINCQGVFRQGGAVRCTTLPNAVIEIGGIKSKADSDGIVVFGFDRDAPKSETVKVYFEGKLFGTRDLAIAQREYDISRIDGLPPSQVSSFTKEQLARIKASTARKRKGFASRSPDMGLIDGFDYPLKEVRKTSPFGAQRILNGEKKRPHYGVDIAAPVGTPIYAPADGKVSLADDDLYFEGAMILLDHGQGLISMYLHVSEIDVEPGQVVKRGEKIGAIGSKGRSTGPHLCWRLKWRNRNLDPEMLTKWPAAE